MAINAGLEVTVGLQGLEKKEAFSDHKVLMIGQAAGSCENAVYIDNPEVNSYDFLFGKRSQCNFALKVFRAVNPYAQIGVVPLKEPEDGTQASAKMTIEGSALESMNLKIKTGDEAFVISVFIEENDSQDDIATKINDAINIEERLINSAIDNENSNELLLTYYIKGVVGNNAKVQLMNVIPGVIIKSELFTNGAGVYEYNNFWNNILERHQTVFFDTTLDLDATSGDNTVSFLDWLDGRFNEKNELLGSSGFSHLSISKTEARQFGSTQDTKAMTTFLNLNEMQYTLNPLMATANFAAKRTLRLTPRALLTGIVKGSKELLGSISKASLPYHNTPMPYTKPTGRITYAEIKEFEKLGFTFMIPSDSKYSVLKGVRTMTKTDPTFIYLNAVDSAFAIQEYFFNKSREEFGQTRDTGGDINLEYEMTNAVTIESRLKNWYTELADLALVQAGDKAVQLFTDNMRVTLDEDEGIYSIYLKVGIMGQLRAIDAIISVDYNIAA